MKNYTTAATKIIYFWMRLTENNKRCQARQNISDLYLTESAKDFQTGEVVPGKYKTRYSFECYDITTTTTTTTTTRIGEESQTSQRPMNMSVPSVDLVLLLFVFTIPIIHKKVSKKVLLLAIAVGARSSRSLAFDI